MKTVSELHLPKDVLEYYKKHKEQIEAVNWRSDGGAVTVTVSTNGRRRTDSWTSILFVWTKSPLSVRGS